MQNIPFWTIIFTFKAKYSISCYNDIQFLCQLYGRCVVFSISHTTLDLYYSLVRVDLPWVRNPHFLNGYDTLVFLNRVPHLHFLFIKCLQQIDTLFSMVHVHSDISYKITKISRMIYILSIWMYSFLLCTIILI